MKSKKALAVFKTIEEAEQFLVKQEVRTMLTSKKTICRIIIAPDLIELANKKRNLKIRKAFQELKDRYLDKRWPEPNWIEFQKHESTIGRGHIQTNTLKNKSTPKPIVKKSIALIECEKFARTLSWKQKKELKILLAERPL